MSEAQAGYDIERIRSHFPALAAGAAFFDGPGGTQMPCEVAAAIAESMTGGLSNRERLTATGRAADDIVLAARAAVADLLGADPGGVIFGRSMTSLTYELSRALAKHWQADDEVVVTSLDHDANIRPWVQAAEAVGATVRWVDFDPATAELPVSAVLAQISTGTRLVAVTGASNLLGTRPDITAIARAAHDAGALVYVDGVHLTAHAPIDVRALGADFFAASPYKFLGPHLGTVVADPDLLDTLRPDKLLPSDDAVPERFELGTLPYELLAGVIATVDFLAGLLPNDGPRRQRILTSMARLESYEDSLRARLEDGLADCVGVVLYGHAEHRTPTLLFSLANMPSGQVARELAERGINAPAGSFYAIEPSRRLGLDTPGAIRAGIAPYTDAHDVDRLLTAIRELATAR